MKTRPPSTKRRQTIGIDPLDAYIPSSKEKPPPADEDRPTPQPRAHAKVRATFHLPADLLEEARNAVVHLSGPPVRLTLADLAETAIRRELERLKKAHNGGNNFPERHGELKGGRPIR